MPRRRLPGFLPLAPSPPDRSPRCGIFLCLVLGGYMLATRYKTLYRWLHGGYMSRNEPQNKKPCYRFDSRVSFARKG